MREKQPRFVILCKNVFENNFLSNFDVTKNARNLVIVLIFFQGTSIIPQNVGIYQSRAFEFFKLLNTNILRRTSIFY